MRIEHLVALGLSERVIEGWRRAGMMELLPLQAHAALRTGLLHGRSLAVFAPTSSGKTFLGEMAAMRHAALGGRTVFLVPTKALAEEFYGRLRGLYGPMGFRVVVSTRERTGDDGAICTGQFDLAVMIYEKLRAHLVAAPALASALACVVVDEVQILGEAERAVAADLVLTKLLHGERPPQLVCASAAVDDADRLCEWLKCERLVWRERPVELREGVLDLARGEFAYRVWNTGERAVEQLFEPANWRGDSGGGAEAQAWVGRSRRGAIEGFDEAEFWEGMVRAVRALGVERGEQVLVFVPTRALSRMWAVRFAEELGLPAVPERVRAEVGLHEPSHLLALLDRCLSAGVAFHNADLPRGVRTLVERAFRKGEVRVLVATSTLAQGVNLTCRNVISLPVMVAEGGAPAGVQPTIEPLSIRRFRNQGGRAGRFGLTAGFGRSIVPALDTAWALRWEERFLRAACEPLAPPRLERALANVVLDALQFVASQRPVGNVSQAVGEVCAFAEQMFGARVHGATREELANGVEEAMGELTESGLVTEAGGVIAVSGLGEVAAMFGLQPRSAVQFAEFWRERMRTSAEPTEFELLAIAAFVPDGEAFFLPVTRAEILGQVYYQRLVGLGEFSRMGSETVLGGLLRDASGVREAVHASLKKAFLAWDWVAGQPLVELEKAYGVYGGLIQGLGGHMAWLMYALAATGRCLGVVGDGVSDVEALAERLTWGLPMQARGLSPLAEAGVNRQVLVRLAREGFESVGDLAQCEELARLVGARMAEVVEAALKAGVSPAEATRAGFGEGTRHGHKQLEPQAVTVRGEEGAASALAEQANPEYEAVACTAEKGDGGQRVPNTLPEGRGEVGQAALPGGKRAEGIGTGGDAARVDSAEVVLELDESSPGQVRFMGQGFFLSVLPYRLLLHLARNPRRVVPYAELDEVLWPDAKVEQQQILAHKAAVVRRFRAICGEERANRLLRTIAGHGLYLDLAPEAIRLGGGSGYTSASEVANPIAERLARL